MGMFASVLLCALAFADTKVLALQICLDREGYSCNTIDGVWGRKCERALARYAKDRSKVGRPATPEEAYDLWFAGERGLFCTNVVTAEDVAALVTIPSDPAAKAGLDRMGYETLKEMFAERGHLSRRAIERLNPGVDWSRADVGTRIVIPRFPSIDEELSVWPKDRPGAPVRPEAALVVVSVADFEIAVYDRDGRTLALFPCSIAKSREKVPKSGELKIVSVIPWPNYTYTPDFVPQGMKRRRHVFPGGPNCPIGVAWMGLDLPGYGIHGTVVPESIGNAESHGCFRLANWNAARLYAFCRPGVRVIVR